MTSEEDFMERKRKEKPRGNHLIPSYFFSFPNLFKCSAIFVLSTLLFFIISDFSHAADQSLIDAAKKEGELVIYTSLARAYIEPTGVLFKKKYNLGDDFQVKFTRKATGPVIQMVEAEKMAGSSRWDIVAHSDESTFLRWVDEGLLYKYQPPNIDNIRDEFRDKLGYRVCAYMGMSSIAVYKPRVPEKDWPKSYKDLLDPKWKGKIGIADPNRSGPVTMFTKFMLDLYGWDYIRALGKNQIIIAGGNPALERLFLSGEIDVAVCPNEYSLLMRIYKGDKNIKIIYPEEGAAFFIMWRGINKDAPHLNAAKLWFEFTVSDDNQKLLSDTAGRYITSKNVEMKFKRPEMKLHQIDWNWLRTHKTEMNKRFTQEINKGREEGK